MKTEHTPGTRQKRVGTDRATQITVGTQIVIAASAVAMVVLAALTYLKG